VFNEKCSSAIAKSTREIGANTTAMNAYYVLRGIRTLKVRLDAHQKAVDEVISKIKTHPKVKQIQHPSQKSTPGYEFFKEQCTGHTSLFSIVLNECYSQKVLSKFFNRLEYFGMGYSWGGYESLIIPFPEYFSKSRQFPVTAIENSTCVRVYI